MDEWKKPETGKYKCGISIVQLYQLRILTQVTNTNSKMIIKYYGRHSVK